MKQIVTTPTATVPNPSCCNVEEVLCERCKAAATPTPRFDGAANAAGPSFLINRGAQSYKKDDYLPIASLDSFEPTTNEEPSGETKRNNDYLPVAQLEF